jgi:hypothetical protein
VPEGSRLRAVTAVPADVAGRRALRVELTDAVTLEGKPGVDYVWMFDRLRELYPDGDYEAGADIGPDEWITLKLDIDGTRLTATVNGTETLALSETKAAPVAGAVGLFVDIGSESFFSNLKITPR